jgi:hypothetical protein
MGKLSRLTVESIEPFVPGPDPQNTLTIFIERRDPIVAQAVGIIEIVPIVSDPSCCRIEHIDPIAVRSDPQHTFVISIERSDRAVAQTVIGVLWIGQVACELLRSAVKPAEPTECCADPEPARAVFEDRRYNVTAQAVRIMRIVSKVAPLSCRAIEPIQTAAARPYPEHACTILPDRLDVVVAQAVGIPGIVGVFLKACRPTVYPI